MFRLALRVPSTIPLELDGVTPEAVANLSALEVGKLPVWHGNRSEELGQFFDVSTRITTAPGQADLLFAGDTRNVHRIGAGMSGGLVYVEDAAGRHAGAGMTGGTLVIDSGVGDWLGAEMKGGAIEVRGSAGNMVGAAYRGSRHGMTGGTIHVRGDAGDEVGLLMRRGLIAVEGGVSEFAAASMIAGTLVAGSVGRAVGAGMKRGTLLILAGEPAMGPGFRFSCDYSPAYLELLFGDLRRICFGKTAAIERHPVRCYRGDLVNGGTGEVLVLFHS
ncbi:MAG TPA: formylmethanofuran dehydrogenase subunit C [Fimbriiglobus sp.]|jgi:formylmethanofuran dehydrogenase subunit C|nr:formylmethanofuran dehydrogenase subunit C [Fimbriiglobus sp.]